MQDAIEIIDIGTLFGVRPGSDLDLSSEVLLRTMAHNRVNQALTCSLKAIQYSATAGNDETLALCRAHPTLHPVAAVDPRQAPDCFAEVERCAEAGCVAFRFYHEYQGWAIASQSFRHLLRAVARVGRPAIVHVPTPGDPTALLDVAGGWDMPVILAGVSYPILSEALAVLADAPGFSIEAHRLALPGQVELMAERIGPQRMMFGSWAPLFSQRPSLDMILASELSQEDRSLLLSGNARRVFRLPERKPA